MTSLRESFEEDSPAALAGLLEFLRHASISSDPSRTQSMRACAEWLAADFGAAGLQNCRVLETEGHPAVYAEWLDAPGARTILLYGHYDVQPPEPLELWSSPPFEPVVAEGRIVARGATDDKGQVYMHLAAMRTMLRTSGRLPVNVKVLIEGEEEIGSPNLSPLVQARRDLLSCDLVVISDSCMYDDHRPALCYGLRGLAYFELAVEGAATDLHSGSYGGAVPNPLFALATLLAGLKDEHGRVAVPGFYDDVRPDDPAERARIAGLGFDDAVYCRLLGLERVDGERGYSTLERTWTRPSLDINGLWGGYSGPGSKTVLPNRAAAKLSFRLVPDQHPDAIAELLRSDIAKRCPPGVHATLTVLHGALPWVTEPDHPYIRAAGMALEEAFGEPPVLIREGGSIPVVMTFDSVLHVPIVLLGVGLHEDGAHAPNEHFDLERFQRGTLASALFYRALAKS